MCLYPYIIATKEKLTREFLERKLSLHYGTLLKSYKHDLAFLKSIRPTVYRGITPKRDDILRQAADELYDRIDEESMIWVDMDDDPDQDDREFEWEYNYLKNEYGYNEIFPNVENKGFKYFYPGTVFSKWLINIKIDDDDDDFCLYVGDVRI